MYVSLVPSAQRQEPWTFITPPGSFETAWNLVNRSLPPILVYPRDLFRNTSPPKLPVHVRYSAAPSATFLLALCPIFFLLFSARSLQNLPRAAASPPLFCTNPPKSCQFTPGR